MNIYMHSDCIVVGGNRISNFCIYKSGVNTYVLNNGRHEVCIVLKRKTLQSFIDAAFMAGDFTFMGSKKQFSELMSYLDLLFHVTHLTAKRCRIRKIENPEKIYYGVKIFGLPFEIHVCIGDEMFYTEDVNIASRWVDATNDAIFHSPALIDKLKSRPYTQGLRIDESWLIRKPEKEVLSATGKPDRV